MSTFEIKMPKLGESITEGTIVSWSVKVGDSVQEDDVLFEVSTAKVSAEIPSPVAGKVLELLFSEGDTVAVGTTVALLPQLKATKAQWYSLYRQNPPNPSNHPRKKTEDGILPSC